MRLIKALLSLFTLSAFAASDVRVGNPSSGGKYQIYTNNAGSIQTDVTVDSAGKVGIGTAAPGSPLTVVGLVESTSGGFKFPDASIQTSAATAPAIGGPITGVTTGSVLYGSGGNFAQDNVNFFWDGTNHRLGIGTTTPAVPLDLGPSFAGFGAAASKKFAVFQSGGSMYGLGISAGALELHAGSSLTGTVNPQAVVSSTGKLGIKPTGLPSWQLTLDTTFGSSPGDAASKKLSLLENAFLGLGVAAITGVPTLEFYSGNSTADMVLNSSGRVGIGTESPTVKLDVIGTMRAIGDGASGAAGIFSIQAGNANDGGLQVQILEPTNTSAGVSIDTATATGSEGLTIFADTAIAALDLQQGFATVADPGGNGGNVPHGFNRVTGTAAPLSATCSASCPAGAIATGGGCSNSGAVGLTDFGNTADGTYSCTYLAATGTCTASANCFAY